MGNCASTMWNVSNRRRKALPIDAPPFKLPSPLPTFPSGTGFAADRIDLGGGFRVYQAPCLEKIWESYDGGLDGLGATFFEPSDLPEGFFSLGCYAQQNSRPLHGWVLAGKDESDGCEGKILAEPVDYALVWSSESASIKQNGYGYFWLPVPPEGYKALGFVVTTSGEKPSADKVRCVRSDFTDEPEIHHCIWSPGKEVNADAFGVYATRPRNRGIEALGVSVGTFSAHIGNTISISCLKNNSTDYTSSMPDLSQIQTLFQAYAPVVYFHPNERYLPSSVNWYFSNGALLYRRGNEGNPEAIEPNGANLPQDNANDGEYWLDLPMDEHERERVKKGDLQSAQGYLHVKPMFGGTITDIAIWIFYPFNGPGRAKVQLITVPLGRVGEHIGDWEHLTLRISNFTGELLSAYFSQHSKGKWVDASELSFHKANKFVAYSSLNGHAMYPKPGLVLQGSKGVGIRNDSEKSNYMLDTGTGFSVIAGDYLGDAVTSPPWLNYSRKWGPRISYDSAEDVAKAVKALPTRLKSAVENLVKSLPNELFGEDGPTGPRTKRNWGGDEL